MAIQDGVIKSKIAAIFSKSLATGLRGLQPRTLKLKNPAILLKNSANWHGIIPNNVIILLRNPTNLMNILVSTQINLYVNESFILRLLYGIGLLSP